MSWIARSIRIPVSETQKTLVIAVCVVAMSIMAVGLVWQAEIIASQRDAIRWLESAKFGGLGLRSTCPFPRTCRLLHSPKKRIESAREFMYSLGWNPYAYTFCGDCASIFWRE